MSRAIWSITLSALGALLAVPISYLFQLDVMRVMSWWDYVAYFPQVQLDAAPLGAWQIYVNTAIAMILILIVGFNLIEHIFQKQHTTKH